MTIAVNQPDSLASFNVQGSPGAPGIGCCPSCTSTRDASSQARRAHNNRCMAYRVALLLPALAATLAAQYGTTPKASEQDYPVRAKLEKLSIGERIIIDAWLTALPFCFRPWRPR